MKKIYTILLALSFFFFNEVRAQNNFWSDTPESSMRTANQKRVITPTKFRSLSLDTFQLKQFFKTVPIEFTEAAKNSSPVLSIPMPDGSYSHFSIVESPIMEPGLAAKFPNIKTYSGQGIEDRTATIKIDWTDFGFHAMIYSAVLGSISIDPYARGNKIHYISYSKEDLTPRSFKEEGVEISQDHLNREASQQSTQSGFCFGTQLRTYRLAVACTGEYAYAVGGFTASLLHSAIVTTINRVDGVYEKEVAIRLVLINNNNTIEYVDSLADPFPYGYDNNATQLINASQSVITSNIGSANFDIGHTFSTGGGGLAGLGVVCNNSQKARGITGSPYPVGDAYDIDFVAHEMGHQFGGSHSFNAITGNCGGTPSNRNAGTAVEPGSGITIMAYAGICTATNDLASHSIPYFHTISQGEIGTYSNSSTGNTCAVTTTTGNTAPVVNAGSNYTIPAGTPFSLTGTATDADGDALTYSWEEIDLGTTGANWNSGSKPFFRSFPPTVSGTRYFPQLKDVTAGTQTIGEYLPTTAQTLNFRLTVRDNRNGGGGVCSSEMVLTTSTASAAFKVTSQATATTWTGNGSNTATITWNAGSTATAPFNAANVAILFSADGGLTFPYTLLSSTANDGTENIVIPAVNTLKGRIMVKAIGNVFFSVNSSDIVISAASCSAEGSAITPTASVAAPVGNAALNLSLSPQYATPFSANGTISSTDPISTLAILNSASSGCINYTGNAYSYDAYTFTVSVSGNYTFQRTGAGSIFNFYSNSYDPQNPCANFIASNYTDGLGTAASVVVTLTAGATYVLVEGVYWNTATTTSYPLPFTYSFAVTVTPTGGAVYNGSGVYINPGAGYNYSYVIVDNATNIIKAISSSANLSNGTTYPAGTYTVYGISYNSNNLSTLNSYIGTNFNTLSSATIANPGTFCASLSKNTVTVTVQAVVPVSFLGLKARKQDKNVVLEWATASEVNSDYFSIQRSADGSNFTTELGKLSAAGNSTSIKNYTINDIQPINGWNYYRIKQVDKDGRTTYSNVAAINFEKAGTIVIVYPNPAKDKLTIEYTSTKSGNIQMQVMDSKGSLILSSNATVIAGRNSNTLNIASLSKGVYVLKCIDAENNINFVKFIKE